VRKEELLRMFELANALLNNGSFADAIELYDAVAIGCKSLIVEGQAELQPILLKTQMNRALTLVSLGHLPEALAAHTDVIAGFQHLITAGQTQWRPILLSAQMNRAITLDSLGHLPEALAAYEEVIAGYQQLIAAGQTELQPDLLKAQMNRANTLNNSGHLPEALAAYEEVIAGYQQLIVEGQAELQPILLKTQMNRAITLDSLGHLLEALAAYEEVIAGYQHLIAAGQTELQPDLLKAQMNRANTLDNSGHLPEALAAYEEVIAGYQHLIAAGQTQWRPILLSAQMNQANALCRIGRLPEALVAYEEVIAGYQHLIASGQTELQPNLLKAQLNRANTLDSLVHFPEALVAHTEVIAGYQHLIASGQTELQPDLLTAQMNQSITLYSLGLLSEALDTDNKVIAGRQHLIASGQTDLQPDLLKAQLNHAVTLNSLGHLPEALAAHEEVIAGFQHLIAAGQTELQPDLLTAQMNLTVTLQTLALTFTGEKSLHTFQMAQTEVIQIFAELYEQANGEHSQSISFRTFQLVCDSSILLVHAATCLQQPTSSHISLFHQSVAILERASEQYTVLSDTQSAKFISQFWFVWLSYWLSHDQIEGIFDVLRHTHSRKLAQQALAALEAQATKHPGQQRYLDLLNELRQLEKSLQGPEAGNTAAAGDNNLRLLSSLPLSSVANRESTLKYYHHLQDEARILKAQLIRDGLLPDVHPLESLSLPELQQQLDRDNDVLLHWLFPTAYGIEGQPPCLLMISATETQLYRFPAQAANGNTWTADILQLFNSLHNGLCRDGRAVRDLYATSIAQDDPSAIRQSPAELHETICQRLHQHVWEPVQSWLDTLPSRPRRMHLITQDSSHLLPWQGTFPAALAETTTLHTHPGLFAYLKQHDTQTMTWPTPAHPLWVLADLQQADPLKRLYFLPLEVALLQEIWGNKAVYISHDMSEPPTAERLSGLCLLGHGSFGQFLLGEQKLNDHTLATLKPDFTILDTSACVLAQVQDQQHEPEGFLMGGLLNAQTRWMNGSLMPVDDLLATLRTGLWHYHWSQQANDVADPRTALALAFKQLQEGSWHLDAGFVARLESALRSTMPRIAAQLLADKHWLEQQLENEHELARYEQLKRRLDALLIQSGNLTMPLRRKVDLIWGELQSLASESDLVLKEERIKHWAVRAQACLQGSMTMEIACLTTYWVR